MIWFTSKSNPHQSLYTMPCPSHTAGSIFGTPVSWYCPTKSVVSSKVCHILKSFSLQLDFHVVNMRTLKKNDPALAGWESFWFLVIFQQTSTNFAVNHLMLKFLVTMCWHVSSEKSAVFKTSLTVGCLSSWMTWCTLPTLPSFLTWKYATWMFKILNQICSYLKVFCQTFVLYLWIHNISFLKHFISARICFLKVITKLGANYPFLDVCFHWPKTIAEHAQHKHT